MIKPRYNASTECELIDQSVLDMEGTSSICNEPDVSHTEGYDYVTHAFLALYLLIGNVMLLNLLIAIFT